MKKKNKFKIDYVYKDLLEMGNVMKTNIQEASMVVESVEEPSGCCVRTKHGHGTANIESTVE